MFELLTELDTFLRTNRRRRTEQRKGCISFHTLICSVNIYKNEWMSEMFVINVTKSNQSEKKRRTRSKRGTLAFGRSKRERDTWCLACICSVAKDGKRVPADERSPEKSVLIILAHPTRTMAPVTPWYIGHPRTFLSWRTPRIILLVSD